MAFRTLASEDRPALHRGGGEGARGEATPSPTRRSTAGERPGRPSDVFPPAPPFPGANPPDLSLVAKARAIERGFPTFIFDIFTQYQETGPDYIHSLLTGYEDPPAGVEVPDGSYYNPYFISGPSLAMPPPLSDGLVTYAQNKDESPRTTCRRRSTSTRRTSRRS